jgi:hypothetical protein
MAGASASHPPLFDSSPLTQTQDDEEEGEEEEEDDNE